VGPRLVQYYDQTEAPLAITCWTPMTTVTRRCWVPAGTRRSTRRWRHQRGQKAGRHRRGGRDAGARPLRHGRVRGSAGHNRRGTGHGRLAHADNRSNAATRVSRLGRDAVGGWPRLERDTVRLLVEATAPLSSARTEQRLSTGIDPSDRHIQTPTRAPMFRWRAGELADPCSADIPPGRKARGTRCGCARDATSGQVGASSARARSQWTGRY
jgi:hypothetical protein